MNVKAIKTGRCGWWQLSGHLHQCNETQQHGLSTDSYTARQAYLQHRCACGHTWRSRDVGASNDRETLVYLLLDDLRKVATVGDSASSDAVDAADHWGQ